MIDAELLISSVRERPPLWENPRPEDKTLIQNLWNEVATKCNATDIQVKTKWRHLKDTFINCSKKKGNKIPTWKWYSLMSFLKSPNIKKQRGRKKIHSTSQADSSEIISVSRSPTATISSVPSCKCNEVVVNVNSPCKEREKLVNIGVQTQSDSPEVISAFMSPPAAPISSVQCKCSTVSHNNFNKTFEDTLTSQEKAKLELIRAMSKQEEEHDTTYHFLMSLRDPINSMSIYEQMFVRLKFLEIVTHIIQNHCDGQRTPSPS